MRIRERKREREREREEEVGVKRREGGRRTRDEERIC